MYSGLEQSQHFFEFGVQGFKFQILMLIYFTRYRNKDKVARSVKIVPPDSKLFQVQPCKKAQKAKGSLKSTGKGSAEATDINNMSCRVASGI